jgi:uncharacterized protein YerC
MNARADNLTYGTQKDNVHDCIARGRRVYPVGERNGMTRLTSAMVVEIRELRKHAPLRVVAARFGVSMTTISRIARGVRWQHVA